MLMALPFVIAVDLTVDSKGRLVLVTDSNASVYVVSPDEYADDTYGEANRIVLHVKTHAVNYAGQCITNYAYRVLSVCQQPHA